MNIGIYLYCIFLFFILSPGVLFSVSKNNLIAALFHAIIFSIIFSMLSYKFLEPLDENIYLDPSCNVLLKETDEESDQNSSGLYFIDGSNCDGPQNLE